MSLKSQITEGLVHVRLANTFGTFGFLGTMSRKEAESLMVLGCLDGIKLEIQSCWSRNCYYQQRLSQ